MTDEPALVDDLEFVLPSGVGRPPSLRIEYVRDLTQADMAALASRATARPQSIARIYSSHHSLAKCLATGMKHNQAALVTGYTTVRIQQLLRDPAFQALVADYQTEAKSVFADLAERMNDMSLDAIELLQERLHDKPDEFSIPMLLDVVKAFADRTGHGPGQEVKLTVDRDFIDRPPRETFDEWKERRTKELGSPDDSLGSTARPTNGSNHS